MQVNATLCRMLGYSERSCSSAPGISITHPDDRDLSRPRSWNGSCGDDFPCVGVRKTLSPQERAGRLGAGSRIHRPGQSRRSWHFITHIEDITERKRAEEASAVERGEISAAGGQPPRCDLDVRTSMRALRTSVRMWRRYSASPPAEICANGAELWFGRVHPADLERVLQRIRGSFRRSGGRLTWSTGSGAKTASGSGFMTGPAGTYVRRMASHTPTACSRTSRRAAGRKRR